MSNLVLLQKHFPKRGKQQSLSSSLLEMLWKSRSAKPVQGFTLLELLVVIAIAAILAAIAAPGWLSFTNQRRVNVVREEIFRALQDAQREAQRTKRSYSVSFRVTTDANSQTVPQIAIHRDAATANALPSQDWKNLGTGLGVQPNQVLMYTNLQLPASADPAVSSINKAKARSEIPNNNFPQPTLPVTITFDEQGILPPQPKTDLKDGFLIGVALPSPNNSLIPLNGTQRCVAITTLLASMEIREGAQCNPWQNP
ncbi:prepilin-type N-terminal cleavage/methylation domain-containing protein [Geitlerinema splendidum]|nr:prepilin-type N-terminal cleavage/methylation domain-containing protein [Geitlerinema splendidum]